MLLILMNAPAQRRIKDCCNIQAVLDAPLNFEVFVKRYFKNVLTVCANSSWRHNFRTSWNDLKLKAPCVTLLKVTLLHGLFSTFFKLYKWYQIAQSIIYEKLNNSRTEHDLSIKWNTKHYIFRRYHFLAEVIFNNLGSSLLYRFPIFVLTKGYPLTGTACYSCNISTSKYSNL